MIKRIGYLNFLNGILTNKQNGNEAYNHWVLTTKQYNKEHRRLRYDPRSLTIQHLEDKLARMRRP